MSSAPAPRQSAPALRYPNFLVVGAMKAGTTTLYRDLAEHPDLFLPQQKEPEDLTDDKVLSEPGRHEYARLFRGAQPTQLCGEASTAYTKRPDIEGCPARARELLGGELKIIYVLREPVERAISHYRHERAEGVTTLGPRAAFAELPRYALYSRYCYQIEPWREIFGDERILLVPFEHYVAERAYTIARICRFLGVESSLVRSDFEQAHNVGGERTLARGSVQKRMLASNWYQRRLKPLLPRPVRDLAKKMLLSRDRSASADPIGEPEREILRRQIPPADRTLYEWVLSSWQNEGQSIDGTGFR